MSRALSCLLLVLLVTGCAQPIRAKDVPGQLNDPGRKLYVGKCAKCHKFYDPAKYSEEEWQVWMVKMNRKAKLKPTEVEELTRFIQENLRPTATTNASPANR